MAFQASTVIPSIQNRSVSGVVATRMEPPRAPRPSSVVSLAVAKQQEDWRQHSGGQLPLVMVQFAFTVEQQSEGQVSGGGRGGGIGGRGRELAQIHVT